MTDPQRPSIAPAAALEALLFISGEPLPLGKLAGYLGVSRSECETLLEEVRERLEADQNRGLSLLVHGGVAMLLTKSAAASFVERLTTETLRENLSRASLEVLAIIAYRGPISRPAIDMIRGVNSSYTLRNLLLRGLIERTEESSGRGFLYVTSLRFFQTLGVSRVEELPDFEHFSHDAGVSALVDAADSVTAGEHADDNH